MTRNTLLPASSLAVCLLFPLAVITANAQQITGVPGSPSAATTIDGSYLPNPPRTAQNGLDNRQRAATNSATLISKLRPSSSKQHPFHKH